MKIIGKYLVVLLFICFFKISVFSQYDYLPSFIEKSFRDKYEIVFDKDWEYVDSLFVFRFMDRGRNCSAYFNKAGEWKKTLCEEDTYLLPKSVVGAVKVLYPDCYPFDYKKVETAENTKGYYQYILECDNESFNIEIDEKGNELKKEKIQEKNDDF